MENTFDKFVEAVESATDILDGVPGDKDSPIFKAWKVLNEALIGLETVQKTPAIEPAYEVRNDKDGNPYIAPKKYNVVIARFVDGAKLDAETINKQLNYAPDYQYTPAKLAEIVQAGIDMAVMNSSADHGHDFDKIEEVKEDFVRVHSISESYKDKIVPAVQKPLTYKKAIAKAINSTTKYRVKKVYATRQQATIEQDEKGEQTWYIEVVVKKPKKRINKKSKFIHQQLV